MVLVLTVSTMFLKTYKEQSLFAHPRTSFALTSFIVFHALFYSVNFCPSYRLAI